MTRNPNLDVCQRELAIMVNKIFDQKRGFESSVNKELTEELHKPVIKNSTEGKSV